MHGNYNQTIVNDTNTTKYRGNGAKRSSLLNENALFRNSTLNQILKALPSDELARLSSAAEKVSFTGGEAVYQPDDRIDYIYLPETAVFSQYQILEDGRTCEAALIGMEGILGLQALLGIQTATCWTDIIVPGNALKINKDYFQHRFDNNSLLKMIIFKYLNSYLERLSLRTVCNCHHKIEERFCSWLLMLQERNGNSDLFLTQEQMARCIGVHRPSLTCIAMKLKDDGIIDYSRGKIEIRNRQKLENAACSCYDATMIL